MNDRLKQILIALGSIAIGAALLVGGYRWYTRPLPLSHIFPTAEKPLLCQVQLQHKGAPLSDAFDLGPQQVQSLLDRLEGSRYRRSLSAPRASTGVPVTIDPSARLYFTAEDGSRTEIMLCGQTLVVNSLSGAGKYGHYFTVAGQLFQQELVDWLAEIL